MGRESIIENKIVIPGLEKEGYIFRKDIKTYEDVLENFWEKSSLLNNNGIPFTDNEKKIIFAKMNLEKIIGNKGRVKNAFKLKYVFEGFDFTKDDGTNCHFRFLDSNNIENNTFEVAHQVALDDDRFVTTSSKNKKYLDVLIIINGIPRVWFELKEESVSRYSAIRQEIEYHDHCMYGLMNYVTIFAVSTNLFSRYTVNNEVLSKNSYWKWKDENNNDVDDSAEFVSSFFNRYTLIDMLTNCVFVKYGKVKNLDFVSKAYVDNYKSMFLFNEEQNIILKGYQYRAFKAAYKNATYFNENSVCWLHMGTGKTLISLCLFAALKRAGYQVIFYVDRKNLNNQSKREYMAFDPTIIDSVDESKILQLILDGKSFITTLHKFNAMLTKIKKDGDEETLKKLKDISSRIQFLQDEVHRSQGKMIQAIEKYFPESKKHGFTGTPLLTVKQLSDKTKKLTLDLFGLSKFTFEYQCINAMEDGETTKIRIEEVKTNITEIPDIEEIEEIEDELDEEKCENVKFSPKLEKFFKNKDRILANSIYTVNALAKKCILNLSTKKLMFRAQFIASSVDCVNLYYHAFKEAQKKLKTEYTIFPVGEAGANVEYTNPKDYSKKIWKLDIYKSWIEDFNKKFGTNYEINQYEKYEADVIKKALSGEIDMIICCSKLTTGFDNPQENTVFIDRFFSYALLLQVVARATRLFFQKEFANVVSFVPIKTTFDEALRLYNKNTDLYEHVSWVSYVDAVEVFIESVKSLRKIASSVEYAKKIENKDKRKEFIEAFLVLYKNFRIIQSYAEYEFDEVKFGIKENEIYAYKGIIANWRDENSEDGEGTFEETLNYNFELIDDECLREIDTDYIRRLISKIINMKDEKAKKKEADKLIKQINSSTNEFIIAQKEILLKSIEEALKSTSMEDYYSKIGKIVEEMKNKDIEKFVTENDIDSSTFKSFMDRYSSNENKKELEDFVDKFVSRSDSSIPLYKKKRILREGIKIFIHSFNKKYTMCY